MVLATASRPNCSHSVGGSRVRRPATEALCQVNALLLCSVLHDTKNPNPQTLKPLNFQGV
jgi:hypothetical protein